MIKAQKVIGGNKQHDYITKEDVSSTTVSAEAVMLSCVIDAAEDRYIMVVDIPNAFAQTVVSEEDAEHRVIVCIRGPLVDILVSIAPDVYGPCINQQEWSEGTNCEMSQCSVWIDGCSIAVLQEVCKEPHKEVIQTQPI
jgi:hypothetical protein